MTSKEYITLTEPVEDAYMMAEDSIIMDIAKRLSVKGGVTSASEYQLEKLAEMGALRMDTIKIISKCSGVAQTEITKAVTKVTKSSVKDIDNKLKDLMVSGSTGAIIPSSERVASIVGAISQNTKNIGNITNATLLNNACDAYKKAVNNIEADLIAFTTDSMAITTAIGAETVLEAVTKEVDYLASHGIAGFTDKAGHMWKADTYMTMVARTNISNAYLTAQKQRALDYGVDTFQVIPHMGARPLCAPYQGYYYTWGASGGTIEDLYGHEYKYDSIYNTSYGQPAGLFGINCRHITRVCPNGLFVPRDEHYDKKEEQQNAEMYANQQKQRYLEREVRSAKREALAMKEIGNEEAFTKASLKLQQKQANMVEFCNTHGLAVRSYRTSVAGYTKSVSIAGKQSIKQYLKALESANPQTVKIAKKALTMAVDQSKLQYAGLKQKLADMGTPVFEGIWKEGVTLEDWNNKKGKIQAKEDYFKEQLAKDPDNPKWQKLLDELHDYDAKGAEYWALKNQISDIENPIIRLRDGKVRFVPEGVGYTPDRLDSALWAKNPADADKMLRPKAGEVWRNASEAEKDAIWDYTGSYSKFNEPLRGYEYGTQKKLGVGNVDLDSIGVDYWHGYKKGEVRKEIEHMSDIIEKSTYDSDIWIQRGCSWKGMDDFFGIPMDTLQNGSEKRLSELLIGNEYTEHAFMSCGTAKGRGFSDHPIIMNVFAPRGTKMMYAEPFSQYGHGSGRKWDGLAGQKGFGRESEIIAQHGTRMLCTKLERTREHIFVDMEIVGQGY